MFARGARLERGPAPAADPRRRAGAALGIRPGPPLGELLHELEEAAYAGEVPLTRGGDRLRARERLAAG